MTSPERIDSHLHLWDLERGGYDWLTPEAGALFRSFGPDDASTRLSAAGIAGAVLVQAEDSVEDTEYLVGVAEQHAWVRGVVGWVQLDDPERARAQLDRWGAHAIFRGVRHLVHNESRRNFLSLTAVRTSLQLLSDRGLAFDVPDAWPDHLSQVTALARDLPDLAVVIDHLAKPPRDRDGFGEWRLELGRAARAGRTFAKVSGLRSAVADYSAVALKPIWETALELFGPARLLWGSDWPMTESDGGYGPTFDVLSELIGTLSPTEQRDVYGGTATRVYSLASD